jgi:hypothetical protein
MEKVFKNRKTGELAYYKDGVFKQGNCSVEIGVEPSSEFWERVKEPILTTEDNVDIFEGDDYYYLVEKDLCYHYVSSADKRFDSKKEGLLDFKYKENAEEYRLMNKPLLSLNDLLSVWGDDDSFDVYKESPMFQDFKNLAKTKL